MMSYERVNSVFQHREWKCYTRCMSKQSKVLFIVSLITIASSLFAIYYRFFLTRNYDIYMQVNCDPQRGSCYKNVGCPQDLPDCSNPKTTYYKILRIKAFELSYCDHNADACPNPVCTSGADCAYISCDPNLKAGAQVCGDGNTE